MNKLNKDDLAAVAGGFQEVNKDLPTKGLNIKCPKCGSSKGDSFLKGALYDDSIGSVQYQCRCGCAFVVYKSRVILKNDFIKLCKDKGISYPFV